MLCILINPYILYIGAYIVNCLILPVVNSSCNCGGAVAERVRVLAWTGDRTAPAGFESHCGKLRFGSLASAKKLFSKNPRILWKWVGGSTSHSEFVF